MNLGNINKLVKTKLGLFLITYVTAISVTKTVSGEKNEETLTTVLNNVTIELCENETLESCATTVDSNISSEITVAGNNTTITTTELNAINTTAAPTSTEMPALNTHFILEKDCHCDMTKQICDVNCCCDRDCSNEDRLVFSHCHILHKPVDPRYCFSQQFIYRNKTQYTVTVEQSGLFCILVDNTVKTTEYTNLPVVTSLEQISKLTDRTEHFTWSSHRIVHTVFDHNAEYRAGSVIWTVYNGRIAPFELTGPAVSTLCKLNMRVSYLQPFDSVCNKFAPISEEECSDLKVTLPIIIASPKLYNFTKIEECPEDVCLVTKQFMCETHTYENNSCVETNITKPVYSSENRSCLNVVSGIHYVMYHNGVQGIYQVKVYFNVVNFSLVESRQLFRYKLKVTFQWLDKNYRNNTLKRSGYLGYLTGMPLISGQRVSKSEKDDNEKEVVEINADEKDWISIGVAGNRGECSVSSRQNIVFGINRQTKCIMNITGDCTEVQKAIWHQLLGESVNITENSVNLYVSSYGDPHTDIIDDWVPVLLNMQIPSDSLISSFGLQILYTYVDSVKNPQAKIIGISMEPTNSVDSKCQPRVTNVSLSVITAVTFIDVTKPAVTKFARPPVYEIKLPEDFFYPFLSQGVCLTTGVNHLILIMLSNLMLTFTVG